MRALGYWLTALVAAVVQATFLAGWRPLGIVPGLALVVVAQAAVVGTASQALLAAVSAGVVLDLAAGDRFGFNTTFLVVVALAVAWLRRGGTVFNIGLELLGIGLASVMQAALAVALTFGHARLPIGLVISHALLTAGVNMVVGLLIYGPLRVILHPAPPEEVRGYAKA